MAKRVLQDAWSRADEVARGDIEVVEGVELADGFQLVRLLSKDALYREGDSMGHCLKNVYHPSETNMNRPYDRIIQNPDSPFRIYSIRTADNESKVTLFINQQGPTLLEARGRCNAPPKSDYIAHLIDIVEALGLKLNDNCGLTGLLFQDGEYFEVTDLPPYFVCYGDFDVSDNKNLVLRRLPHVVNGDLNIYGTQVTLLDDVEFVGGRIFAQKLPKGDVYNDRIMFTNLEMAKDFMRRRLAEMTFEAFSS